jgi:dinuclear metal center YbgI/SA1388 family protein
MTVRELERWLNGLLRVREIPDDSLNGIQVANSGKATKIAVAVDVSETAIKEAAKAGANFLVVHHGLFWGKPAPLVGPTYGRIRLLMEYDIALYASHLPLDLHRELGNNAQLCEKMGWKSDTDFGDYHGVVIGKGVSFSKPLPLEALTERLTSLLRTEPVVWRFGPDTVKRVAVISGGAMGMIDQVAGEGYDAYITGEFGHCHYWFAKEARINVLFGGHYATETWGVDALGKKITRDLGLEAVFLDLPTGY